VLSEKPAISEFIVALNQLDAVAFCQAQLVGAAGYEIICMTTTSVSATIFPGLWNGAKGTTYGSRAKYRPGQAWSSWGWPWSPSKQQLNRWALMSGENRNDGQGRSSPNSAPLASRVSVPRAGPPQARGSLLTGTGRETSAAQARLFWRRRRSARGFDAVN
jgi:hypothetical protein